jgi:hypothetical protein
MLISTALLVLDDVRLNIFGNYRIKSQYAIHRHLDFVVSLVSQNLPFLLSCLSLVVSNSSGSL